MTGRMPRVRLAIIQWAVICCVSLFALRYTPDILVYSNGVFTMTIHPSVRSEQQNLGDVINIGFSLFQLEQAKLREKELAQEYNLTAIVLHWQRLEGVRQAITNFLQTRLFREIIVWNNNPKRTLTISQLLSSTNSTISIRIVNSKANLKDEAKYRACAEATSRACFYVDDDWDISHYIRSLVASFRSDPELLHAVTDPYTYYTNLVWSYFDSAIDLHTGFSWIGCGGVFLRAHAQRHLQLLHKFLINDSDLILLSDVFFAIWSNDIPTQMNTDIRARSDQRSVPFSSTAGFANLQYRGAIAAIRILERSLRSDRVTFPRQSNRRFPYYIKSPSRTDNFIFYSNVLPFNLHNATFNISRDYERATRRSMPHGPYVEYVAYHSTLQAVDSDLTTCWHSARFISAGDFYAIDFLQVQTNGTFLLSVAHGSALQSNLDVSVSFDGLWWMPYRSQNGIYTGRTLNAKQQNLYTILYASERFNQGFQSFRYIKFQTTTNSSDRFQVCEVELIPNNDISRMLRGVARLETSTV